MTQIKHKFIWTFLLGGITGHLRGNLGQIPDYASPSPPLNLLTGHGDSAGPPVGDTTTTTPTSLSLILRLSSALISYAADCPPPPQVSISTSRLLKENKRREKRDMKVDRSELQAGDHIYVWRLGFIYSHHGIYIGKDKVVHLTQRWNLRTSSHSSSTSFRSTYLDNPNAVVVNRELEYGGKKTKNRVSQVRKKGQKKNQRTGVILSSLDSFIRNGSLYRYEYGVSRGAFIAKLRGGTCTTANSEPPEVVINNAKYLLRNGFGKYDVIKNNCEDFALYCKTGILLRGQESRGGSGQASSALSVPVAVIHSLALLGFVSSPACLVAAAAVIHAFNKYSTDVGVRDDAVKVKVEEMAKFRLRKFARWYNWR
ncbi:hypothetical protein C2S52_006724 [Perilla frutescens var. hirtella]|nr:hypothetical protein C2S51_008993 [Perilla frutescens var. frutescens]KAH6787172.1 hypothetical protein C2S52_006724 [Perilla frutescens var. hirtella]